MSAPEELEFKVGDRVTVVGHKFAMEFAGQRGRVLAVFDGYMRVWLDSLNRWEEFSPRRLKFSSVIDRLARVLE